MPVTGTAIQAGIGLAKTVEGLVNAGKTKREAAILESTRPKLGRDAIADENLALAKSELANGMSSAAETAYNNLDNNQFSSSLSAILKGGGNLNSIGDLYGNGQEGRMKLARMQDEIRLNQINGVMRASQPVEERDADMFKYNIDAPWKDKAQANGQSRANAQNQIWTGLQTAGSAFMQQEQNDHESDQTDKILGIGKYGKEKTGTYNQSDTFNPRGVSDDLQKVYYNTKGVTPPATVPGGYVSGYSNENFYTNLSELM